MTTKIYHGNFTPNEIANNLISNFNQGNLKAQKIINGADIIVQISTAKTRRSGGETAITVNLTQHEDGVSIQMGRQSWMGVAASIGTTTLAALRNPMSLLGRLDDIAQDIESMQITEKIWEVVDNLARAKGASLALSEKYRRVVCQYCDTANEVGEPQCVACGAPLGSSQPITCPHCGFVVSRLERTCPSCRRSITKS